MKPEKSDLWVGIIYTLASVCCGSLAFLYETNDKITIFALAFTCGVFLMGAFVRFVNYQEWKKGLNIESKPEKILKDLQQLIDNHKI